ncbi:molybdenum cofactor biosynthesis protein MoaE [candidate division KSB1 bacterium]|nr:molybdenum cofactor biosynthesis protein MoaE [candidate division KSB1 bacterium]NIR71390.1 molybdenum cofactor biosynthesis protein MoaE [candidate division KSB1 bacterium]NIS26284.1 molybdenum cofactor biosynthesis protein MoaE [candidate division KSB1 bacterium]NIT73046.1 molybdenum cofactor biosynthesis protein MoaE [candidate division KSB1 bacterium]NIU26954.1 molybdenum cofactor biosynthesis protein MoaE [candidate division KSB1 bacterium]
MVELVAEKISVDRILEQLEDHSTGGVAIFLGRVRNHAEGREVEQMDYEAYPEMALKKMRGIEETAKKRWPVKKMVMVHRTGRLQLGEVSVAIAVACAHRNEAFEACRFAIDTLKETVPIWKKEYFADGEAWVEGVVPKSSV